ncbi:MAG: putative acetyltransferase [Limisphaerales bacterium]|jgi:putative acetyltransferase
MSEPSLRLRDMFTGEEAALWALFHATIHSVNAKHYSPQQLAAWSPKDRDMAQWAKRMQSVAPFVVVAADEIVGFSDLQADGLVDFMFVHTAWQGRGVATLLMSEIEKRAADLELSNLYAHVSVTARPFFESQGFEVEHEQSVRANGVSLSNFYMIRNLR